ncbi:hypothetical protein DFR70_10983 [Nocardia tenerifensis]|uniref:Uncharacterized protein n=1 Tax=Nocardia tenerifensis TaxID=228006 RepID=A0A318JZW1_9NOCA|nr:hypothetical protein [Nocardia tenerifensis]PXX60892.1 hypothetical protein DFR70_10983 [Nocardia tenerifensis]
MVSSTGDVIAVLIGALDTIDGLRPATPLGAQSPAWWPWDARSFAFDVAPGRIEIRVAAAALPLAPLLEKATAALRAALAGTEWSDARLRVVVTELDAGAFGSEGVT